MEPANDHEIITIIEGLNEDKQRLLKKISYLESVLSEILMLNSLGKTLKINEAINAAVDHE
jgi:hypothetical protein